MPAVAERARGTPRKWAYRARRTEGGELVRGIVEAVDHPAAVRELRRQGLAILSVELGDRRAAVGEADTGDRHRAKLARSMGKDDVVAFAQQLSVMLKTGVPLAEALETFAEQAPRKDMAEFVRMIRTEVCEGEDFSAVLGKHPRTFPTVLVSLMRAAEASGKLDEMLGRVAKDLAKSRKTARQVRGAMTYPAIMMAVAVVAVAVIMVFVLPKFGPLFKAQGDRLPTPTKALVWLSGFLRTGWAIYVPVLLALAGGTWWWARTEAGRIAIDTAKLRMPVLGHMFRSLYLVRFSSTMGSLMAAGVPLVEIVRICRDVTGNVHYERLWTTLEERIEKGQEIAPTFREFDFVPRNVVAMIASGEKSGRLSEVLDHAAAAAEDDLDIAVKSATSLVEPILIVGMGLVVGGIAAAMLLPIFNMSRAMRPGG